MQIGNRGIRAAGVFVLAAMTLNEVRAQQPSSASGSDRIDPVVVTATRVEQQAFDLPVAIDSVGAEEIRRAQLQVNLSESLARIPGLVTQNRQNYAQDLQVSSRGFGARATFGVRGIRLYQDGIPATQPDGQGQTASFSLSSAQRIEVLRGPFSALYGNASGGVIQVFTEDGPPSPEATLSGFGGSWESWRAGTKVGGTTGAVNYLVDGARFETGGYREHSAARRDQLNAKLKLATPGGGRLTLVGNVLDQPETQDPLGLSRAQWQADPRAVDPAAHQFDTRKSTAQRQVGAVHEQPLGADHALRVAAYAGQRKILQFLALTGAAITSSGGVTDLDRSFGGVGVRWTWRGRLAGAPLTLSLGGDYDTVDEHRLGMVNQGGSLGARRRDEDNTITSRDVYGQLEWQVHERVSLLLGARSSRVDFESNDRFVVAGNPDDSGSRSFSATNPVAGVVWHATDSLNLYANAGRGFETPTIVELAYRPGGTGLNFALDAATSRSYEAGVKWRPDRTQRLALALFRVDTDDEIVVDQATGGRTTYKNAAGTRRRGVELAWEKTWPAGLRTTLAWTIVDAVYTAAFTSGGGTPTPAGNRMPGIPRQSAFAEIAWTGASGLLIAVDVRHTGKVFVDDRNSDAAPAYTVANARLSRDWQLGPWTLEAFARVENLADRKYVGSVIVGDSNGRFFEPAPERSFYAGASARFAF